MRNKAFVTYLLFRGSIDGWYCGDFHLKCDNVRNTISLFKMIDGDCIGGYTDAYWSSSVYDEYRGGRYINDNAAVLFNLTKGIF